jgi:hypothetical protein
MNASKSFVLVTIILFNISPLTLYAESSDSNCQETQKELLKRLFRYECRYYWEAKHLQVKWLTAEDLRHLINDKTQDIIFHRAAVLLLTDDNSKEAYELLVQLLGNDNDAITRLYAAGILAYYGHREGLNLLKLTASGKNVLTQSGFELNWAALGLLLLNEPLPPEYHTHPFADKLFLKLDAQNH